MRVPTLIVAGTASGVGKTTVTCALAAALAARGVDVRLFKAGPDYLDPTWHRVATGRPARNLDAWMTGEAGVRQALARGCAGLRRPALALVEGVMGLFDGRDPAGLDGSAAQLAVLLGAPVVLVVDAGGMARSAVALVEGFAAHVPEVAVRGVVFNRVGSPGHLALLREAMALARPPRPLAVLGGLVRDPRLELPARHLGLVAARAAGDPAWRAAWRERLVEAAEATLDLPEVLRLAEAHPVEVDPPAPLPPSPGPPVRIGVAEDDAFHFTYPDNLDLLREAGAELLPFSPLADPAPPPACDGLLLGGGYPEVHAAELAANAPMRRAIRAFCASGRPVYGECGGLMYLGREIEDGEGVRHPMAAALPLATRVRERARVLGYREVTTLAATPLGPPGARWRGHEFHVSELVGTGGLQPVLTWTGRRGEGRCGWQVGRTLATWVHAHWGGAPEVARAFVRTCREAR